VVYDVFGFNTVSWNVKWEEMVYNAAPDRFVILDESNPEYMNLP
jgi:hypothetical protein